MNIAISRGRDLGGAGPLVEIALQRPEGQDEWHLDWIKMAGSGVSNVLRCDSGPIPVKEAFEPDFIRLIRPYLPPSGARPAVLSAAGPFEVLELQLAQMRVLVSQARDGIERLMLRFQHALGPVLSVLKPRLRPEGTGAHHMEQQAARMLADLMAPCLDLAALDRNISLRAEELGRVAAQMRRLSDHHDEMSFFTYLLRRFLVHGPQALTSEPEVARVPVERPKNSCREILDR